MAQGMREMACDVPEDMREDNTPGNAKQQRQLEEGDTVIEEITATEGVDGVPAMVGVRSCEGVEGKGGGDLDILDEVVVMELDVDLGSGGEKLSPPSPVGDSFLHNSGEVPEEIQELEDVQEEESIIEPYYETDLELESAPPSPLLPSAR